MQAYQRLEGLAHQNRERIPERVVHAKGWGAHGTFTLTEDVTRYARASLFAKVDPAYGVDVAKALELELTPR